MNISRSNYPVDEACGSCDESNQNYKNLYIPDADIVRCLSCLLEDDSVSTQALENLVINDMKDGDVEVEHRGYSASGTFGEYMVEFKTETAQAKRQTYVDGFQPVGTYRRLTGDGNILLEIPKYGQTGFEAAGWMRGQINSDREKETREQYARY